VYFPTLGSIASRDVIYLGIDATVEMAVEKMHEHNHRDIIIKSHSLYYVFTTQDMVRLKLDDMPFTTHFRDIPLKQVPLLGKEQNVITALDFLDEENEYICVSDDDSELYGLVTNNDIVASVDPQIMLENLTLGSMFDSKFGFISLDRDYSMRDVMCEMDRVHTDCIIVTEQQMPIGIVTSKDILRYFKSGQGHSLPLAHYMSAPLQTLAVDCSIADALKFLQQKEFKRIIVAKDDGSVVGIINEQELISRTYLKWSSLVKEHFSEFEELTQILNQKNKQLTKMATRDALTSIANRYLFEELFEKELAQSNRYDRVLSLIIMDIDHFKSVNDTHGHNAGDSVLKELSTLIISKIRLGDTFARWGGEEFVLMLPSAVLEEAEKVALKLRSAIEAHAFDNVGRITCSFGITQVASTDRLESAIAKSDRALYEAKENGRNQVICYRETE